MFLFGTTPLDIFNNIGDYWWTLFFGYQDYLQLINLREKINYMVHLGMISYFLAFAIWTTGVPDHQNCSPDSLFKPMDLASFNSLSYILFFIHYRSEQKLI